MLAPLGFASFWNASSARANTTRSSVDGIKMWHPEFYHVVVLFSASLRTCLLTQFKSKGQCPPAEGEMVVVPYSVANGHFVLGKLFLDGEGLRMSGAWSQPLKRVKECPGSDSIFANEVHN